MAQPAEAPGRGAGGRAQAFSLSTGDARGAEAAPPGLPSPSGCPSRRPLPAQPSSSSHSCLREETARPPADVPFFLLPLSHTRHMAPASGPTGPTQQLLPPSLPPAERRGRAAPALQDRGEREGADSAKPAGDTSALAAGFRKYPRAMCTPGGRVLPGRPPAHGRTRGPEARDAPCNEPGPPGCLPRWTMCSEGGDRWPGSWTPGNVSRLDAGPEVPPTRPVSSH